jgi:hypothetical protein
LGDKNFMRLRASSLRRELWLSALTATGLASCTPPSPPPVAVPVARPTAVFRPPSPPVVGNVPTPRRPEFRQLSVVFYQPEAVLRTRLGDDTAPLAAYVRQIDRSAAAALRTIPNAPGFQAALVIALKPGGTSHAWLVTRRKLPPDVAPQLVAAAQAEPPLSVQGGPVAFAIIFNALGGGGPAVTDAAHPIPIPTEWRKGVAPLTLQGPAPAPLSQ